MIGRLTGRCAHIRPDGNILIDVGGVGYAVRTPASTLASLHEGDPATLFIHTAVREDAIDLYGFLSEKELSFFKLLTSVSGVGPKTALGVLNVADVESLSRAVAAGDASALTKVYGLGKKSAERIVVELRDKLAAGRDVERDEENTDMEVLEALQALGYSAAESREALRGVAKEEGGVKERLAAALKHLGSPAPKRI